MAIITDISPQTRFAVGFDRPVESVSSFLLAIGTVQSRVQQIELFCSKSHEELAARGFRRQDIVRQVYRDVYHV
jgi:hypothetical protein